MLHIGLWVGRRYLVWARLSHRVIVWFLLLLGLIDRRGNFAPRMVFFFFLPNTRQGRGLTRKMIVINKIFSKQQNYYCLWSSTKGTAGKRERISPGSQFNIFFLGGAGLRLFFPLVYR